VPITRSGISFDPQGCVINKKRICRVRLAAINYMCACASVCRAFLLMICCCWRLGGGSVVFLHSPAPAGSALCCHQGMNINRFAVCVCMFVQSSIACVSPDMMRPSSSA
jgi:hypothetical protein